MIALLIGLFIILGVVVVYIGAVRTQVVNESLARVQENGRFAIGFLSRDIRLAGYSAACPAVNNLLDESDAAYDDTLFSLERALTGWDNDAGDHAAYLSDYVAGTDVIALQFAARDSGLTATGNTPANAANINLTASSGIPAGTIILVADHEGCDLFQNRANEHASTLNRGVAGGNPGPGNKNPSTNTFSHQYTGDMQIFRFDSVIYYIGTGANGRSALRRVRFSQGIGPATASEELVSDIADMQIEYGVDPDGDQVPDSFVAAGGVTDWQDVIAVRLWLLTEGERANALETPQQLPAPFDTVDVSDRRLRQVFFATNAIRNRLP